MAQLKDLLVEGKSRFIDKIYASDQFISKVVQGTSPFLIDSSTLVSNLNADLLDGYHAERLLHGAYNKSVVYDILEISRTDTPQEIIIKTKLPFTNGNEMPSIYFRGYAYGNSVPMNVHLVFYIYGGAFCNYSAVSYGAWNPRIFLFTYVEGGTTYVGIGLKKSVYYPRFWIDIADIWTSSGSRYHAGWTYEVNTSTSTTIIPTDNQKEVGYTSLDTSITGSASFATSASNADTVDGKHASDFATSTHTHSFITSAGFSNNGSTSLSTWGTLTTANGYTGVLNINDPNGGSWEVAYKGGQQFHQIDGYYYQNEGRYRVTDVTETVTALGTSENYLTWTKNGSTNNITVPYATASNTTNVLNVTGINTETDITESGIRGYSGEGSTWTGSISSMTYAAILTFGNPSRGWQLWAQRATADGMYWRRGNSAATAWEEPRLFLDSSNYTSYTVTKTGGGASGTWGINITGTAAGLSAVIANDKLPTRLRELCTAQTIADASLGTNSGWAYVTSGSPFSYIINKSDYMLLSTGYNASWCGQIAENFYSNDIAFRTKNSGTWTEWAYPILYRPSNQLSNCNDVSTTGIWTNSGFSNKPSDVSNWGSLFNIRLYKDNNTYHRQLFFDCYGTDKIWTRSDNGGFWTSWVEIVRNTGTWGISITGNAATATKLGTDTVGASNRPIYLNAGTPTAVSSVGEAFLSWGGQNLSSNFGPVDAGILPELGANRAAFISPDNIVVQYSTNGGSSWTDYGATAADKVNLFNGNGAAFRIGKNSTTGVDYTNYRLRIILTPGGLYTTLNKFIILVSTSGSSGCWCTIDARLRSNVNSSTDTWTTFANQVGISGWSGYNIINTSGLTTYGGTPASQYGEIRFTFGNTGYSTSYPGLTVTKIFCIGGVGWTTPSILARTGHMYTYDASQNVSFPASVSATSFIGNASSATTAAGLSAVIANDKLPTRLRELCTAQTVSSGDSATNSGWAYITSGSPFTHIRTANDYMLISTGYNASWCAELGENFYSNDIAFRTKNNGTWTEWAYPIMWRPSNQLSNCNDVSVTGIWTNGGFTNRPSDVSNWGSLFNIRLYKDNNTYHRQLFFDCYGTDKIWTRSDNGGSWTAWTELVRNTGTWNINITGDASTLRGLPLSRFVYSVGSGDFGTSERSGNSENFERTMFWRDNNKSAIGVFVSHSTATTYGWEIHAGYSNTSNFVGRVKENGTWGAERIFITSANVSSYITDTKVTQTKTASSNTSWRPLLLGYSYSDAATFAPTTVTNTTYATHLAKFKPSTGQLAIGGLYKMNTNGTVATGANDEVWNTNGTTVKISTLFTTESEYLTLEVKNATSPSTPITEYVGVTITNKFTNETIYDGIVYQNTHLVPGTTTYTTDPISIPPGIEYVVSCSYITGYAAPDPGIFLSIPGYSRILNLNFIPVRVDILSIDFTKGDAPSAFLTYTPASGTSVVQWIRNNSHRYAAYFAKLSNTITDGNGNLLTPRGAQMYICQLNDSDSTRFANDNSYLYPTDASVENGDIYMRLPKFYYRVTGNSTTFTVEFADVNPNQPGFQEWDSNNMIAVYPSSYRTGILMNNSSSTKIDAYISSPYFENSTISSNDICLNVSSCKLSSATISSSGTTVDKFAGGLDKASIKNMYPNVDVKFLRYKWVQILRLLFMAYYQTTDCVSVCGTGRRSGVYTPSAQGTQGRGMTDTTSSTGNDKPVNFWGVESLWGISSIYSDVAWQYYHLNSNASNVNKLGLLADNVPVPDLLSSGDVVYKFGSVPSSSDLYYGRTVSILPGTPTTMEQKLTYSPVAFSAGSGGSATSRWFSSYNLNTAMSTGYKYNGFVLYGANSLFQEGAYRTAASGFARICYYGPIQEVYSPTVFYNSIKPNSAIYRRLRGNTAIPAG